ncbi:MAG TPA: hypothetical protein VF701_11105 [Thermoanaerobaculia bacterium]
MQYTIEARELTTAKTRSLSFDTAHRPVVIEARDSDEALTRYIHANESELVSLVRPGRSREAIATVRKEDTLYLLRVYSG